MGKKIIRLKAREGAAAGFAGFLAWLASTHPQVYNRVVAAEPEAVDYYEQSHVSGAVLSGDSPEATTRTQQFINAVTAAGTTLLNLSTQQKILKVQLERAKNGQAPLDVGAYIDPNQGVNVGLTPATQKTLLYLGGGLLLAIMLPRILGRR